MAEKPEMNTIATLPTAGQRAHGVLTDVPYLMKIVGRAELIEDTETAIAQQIKKAEDATMQREREVILIIGENIQAEPATRGGGPSKMRRFLVAIRNRQGV